MAGVCPPPRALEAFAMGGDDAPSMTAHVHGCAVCREMVAEIRENQKFLRGAATALADALDARARPASRPGGVPGFELLEEISRGGQGVVYRAVQSATKRPAAVKVLLSGTFATSRQQNRFEREIEIAARLRHPNIVSIFESGVSADGGRYVAMEYVEGEPLDRYIRTRLVENLGRARIDRIIRICSDVASAVGHAHANGVIHRDLKPSNIFVDAAGHPRVLDFGLARELDPIVDATRTREFAGTPAFAAPEQFAGDSASIDVRTDVYSLGVLLYAALTGTHPYPCDGALSAIIEHVRSTEPKPPSAHVPRIPADVDTIVLKALSKDPDRRYPNAQALAADMEDYLAGRPISARRDSTLYILSKLAQRHRLPVAIASAALFAIVAAAIGMAVLSGRLDSQRRKAEAALAESNIQRARLLAKTGDVLRAEQVLWREALDAGVVASDDMGLESKPAARQAAWALLELYALVPKLMTVQAEIKPVSLRFDADGCAITSIHIDGSVEWWSLDGRRLMRRPGFLPAQVFLFAVSRDQRYAARIDQAGTLGVFDVDSQMQVAGPHPWPRLVRSLALSDEGKTLVLVDDCGAADILDTRTLSPLRTFRGEITHATIDGDRLFLTTHSGSQAEVHVHSVHDWSRINTLRIPGVVKGFIPRCVARANPDGAYLLVTSERALFLYDAIAGGDPLAYYVGLSPFGRPEFETEGQTAVAAAQDGTITSWSVPDLQPLRTLRNMQGISAIAIHKGLVATASQDASITVWHNVRWPERRSGSTTTTHGLAISRDGSTIAAGDDQGWLRLQRVAADGQDAGAIRAHSDMITSIDFAPSGERLVTAGEDGAVREWTTPASPLRDVATDLGPVQCVRYSSDGDWIAASGRDGRIHLWHALGDVAARVLGTHGARVPQVDFSPDGHLLSSVSQEGDAILWNVQDGTCVRTFGRRFKATRAITFSPDGSTIAIGNDDRTSHFWAASTGDLRRTISGMPWGPFDLKYHPSGRVLFAVGRGREVVVVDPEACTELATFRGHEQLIMTLRLSPDGRQMITAGEDNWIGVWDIDHLRRCAKGNAVFNRTGILNEVRQ